MHTTRAVIVLPLLPGEDERTMELDIRNMIKDHQVCYDEGGWLGENVSTKRASNFLSRNLSLLYHQLPEYP